MFCCLLNPFRGRPRLLMEPRVGTAATLASGPDSEQQHFLGLHPQAPPPSAQNAQIMRKKCSQLQRTKNMTVLHFFFLLLLHQHHGTQNSPSVMSQRAPGLVTTPSGLRRVKSLSHPSVVEHVEGQAKILRFSRWL